MNDKVTPSIEVDHPLLVLEDGILLGTMMRFHYNTLAVFLRALKWGCYSVLLIIILKFYMIILCLIFGVMGFHELITSTLTTLLRVSFGFFCFGAFYSVIAECVWRRLTISSNDVKLKFYRRRLKPKQLQEIRDIEVLYHTGTKLALKIYWLKGHAPPWVVGGTVSEATLDDVLATVASILTPEQLSQTTGVLSMRWRSQIQLRLAGWHPGRDVDDYANSEMNEHAQKALREYGGLHVSCIPPESGELIFEPPEDAEFEEVIRYFSDKLGLDLSFIGACDGGDYVPVVVSQYGAVYLMFVDELRGIGTSVPMAIDRLIGGNRWVDVLASKQLGEYKRDDPLPE